MDTPAAEVDIDESLVRSLLREQHPDLAGLTLTPVTNGWDNAIFRLGDELAVRVPRRLAAAALVEHEQRWLPEVASRVTVPVPVPLRTGQPSELFHWHWSVTPWLHGELASEVRDDAARISTAEISTTGSFAAELASFLREFQTPAPATAPINPFRGTALAARADSVDERLESGLVPHAARVRETWQRALAAPAWSGPPSWVHGDLHPANILIRDGGLGAVLDFGDICGGDPATDLATAWLTFGPDGRSRFRAELGDHPGDEASWLRGMGWAIILGTALVANSADNPAMHRIGQEALEQVLADPA